MTDQLLNAQNGIEFRSQDKQILDTLLPPCIDLLCLEQKSKDSQHVDYVEGILEIENRARAQNVRLLDSYLKFWASKTLLRTKWFLRVSF